MGVQVVGRHDISQVELARRNRAMGMLQPRDANERFSRLMAEFRRLACGGKFVVDFAARSHREDYWDFFDICTQERVPGLELLQGADDAASFALFRIDFYTLRGTERDHAASVVFMRDVKSGAVIVEWQGRSTANEGSQYLQEHWPIFRVLIENLPLGHLRMTGVSAPLIATTRLPNPGYVALMLELKLGDSEEARMVPHVRGLFKALGIGQEDERGVPHAFPEHLPQFDGTEEGDVAASVTLASGPGSTSFFYAKDGLTMWQVMTILIVLSLLAAGVVWLLG